MAVEIKIEDVTNLYTLPRSARHRERGISLSHPRGQESGDEPSALHHFTTVNLADQNAEQIPASGEDGSVTVTLAIIYHPQSSSVNRWL